MFILGMDKTLVHVIFINFINSWDYN
jgi:hypothetical protein